ncbi:MAG: preprotein translocase subunit SecA [Verrucomicrobiaceae bacterium]|nr:preprotein translocase subunit SecA [Verrucomicrobiaceae bacterium]
MFNWIIKKIIGSKHQRIIKKLGPVVAEINRHEEKMQSEPEEALRERTAKWKDMFRAFHTPAFLSGVNLRVADDATLEDSLRDIHNYFVRLKPHFSTIDEEAVSESSWTGKSAEEKRALIESAHQAWSEIKPKFADLEAKLLDDILPEVYAVVKNAARRLCGQEVMVTDQPVKWNMVHFDVQLIGGIALHRGMIAEMATGEGKTLVGTLPVALNALTGRGVHVVTVNDYLARRDSEWMGHLYKLIGLTIGCIQNDQPSHFRREQYLCDITYGTNSEFGFDYLRDNGMASSKEQQVQRGHYFAIVDEVDSVLIDEARTPLIISGPVTVSTHQFDRYKPLVEQLVRRQNNLCARLMSEAKELFDKGESEAAGKKLYQVALGQPKNRALMRAMEDTELRKLREKTELSYALNDMKVQLFNLKEELYYSVDEKSHESDLTEMGRSFLNPDDPDAFVLPDIATAFAEIDGDTSLSTEARQAKKQEVQERLDHQGQKIHNITQLLRAYCLYEKDVHYVVEENKVVIVDEHTGRKMNGRRWSDGLHGAVEAKEGVQIDAETQTLATITIQNYFRLYQKLGGMTGTAETDASEFHDIYRLDVLPIPTNRPVKRIDQNDSIFKTRREKYNAVIDLIKERHAKGQPILVGTASVEASETVSRMLKLQKIPHSVLNAKYHRQEAEIVARAGQRGAVTISTNMAGRGTDIKLGEGVADVGGLFVVATERHESRRIDRQLRGRCARQGDPGESKFYISFEDDLMRRFGAADRMTKMMETFGMKEGEELQHPWLNRSVETAQKRVEQQHYVWRKRVLEYDDVMNQQREVVYEYRNDVIESSDTRILIDEALSKGIHAKTAEFLPEDGSKPDESSAYENLLQWANMTFPIALSAQESDLENKTFEQAVQLLVEKVQRAYNLKVEGHSPRAVQDLERMILLNAIDRLWQEHLYALDALKEGVGLRSYGQKDPLIEFKQEAYSIFAELMHNINYEVLNNLFRGMAQLQAFEHFLAQLAAQRQTQLSGGTMVVESGESETTSTGTSQQAAPKPKITLPNLAPKAPAVKAGRNDPCPCGSGRKYKACCGRLG